MVDVLEWWVPQVKVVRSVTQANKLASKLGGEGICVKSIEYIRPNIIWIKYIEHFARK